MRLIEIDESSTIVEHCGCCAVGVYQLFGSSDDFHGELFEGSATVTVVEIKHEKPAGKGSYAVAKAYTAFADILDPRVLANTAGYVDEKMRRQFFPNMEPVIHTNRKREQEHKSLPAVFACEGLVYL